MDCFSQIFSGCLASNQGHDVKGIRITASCVFGVLNDKFVQYIILVLMA